MKFISAVSSTLPQTDKQTNRQTNRQTDKQTSRQTDKQTNMPDDFYHRDRRVNTTYDLYELKQEHLAKFYFLKLGLSITNFYKNKLECLLQDDTFTYTVMITALLQECGFFN